MLVSLHLFAFPPVRSRSFSAHTGSARPISSALSIRSWSSAVASLGGIRRRVLAMSFVSLRLTEFGGPGINSLGQLRPQPRAALLTVLLAVWAAPPGAQCPARYQPGGAFFVGKLQVSKRHLVIQIVTFGRRRFASRAGNRHRRL